MKPNTVCTVFKENYNADTRKNDWTATIIRGVFWQGSAGQKANKAGMVEDNETFVYIPFSAVSDFVVSPKDKIYRGETALTTPIGLDGALTVTSVDMFDFGSADMQHWEVRAK